MEGRKTVKSTIKFRPTSRDNKASFACEAQHQALLSVPMRVAVMLSVQCKFRLHQILIQPAAESIISGVAGRRAAGKKGERVETMFNQETSPLSVRIRFFSSSPLSHSYFLYFFRRCETSEGESWGSRSRIKVPPFFVSKILAIEEEEEEEGIGVKWRRGYPLFFWKKKTLKLSDSLAGMGRTGQPASQHWTGLEGIVLQPILHTSQAKWLSQHLFPLLLPPFRVIQEGTHATSLFFLLDFILRLSQGIVFF